MSQKQTFLVAARAADGKASVWRAKADSYEEARSVTQINIVQIKPYQRARVVLVCIPGGKQ